MRADQNLAPSLLLHPPPSGISLHLCRQSPLKGTILKIFSYCWLNTSSRSLTTGNLLRRALEPFKALMTYNSIPSSPLCVCEQSPDTGHLISPVPPPPQSRVRQGLPESGEEGWGAWWVLGQRAKPRTSNFSLLCGPRSPHLGNEDNDLGTPGFKGVLASPNSPQNPSPKIAPISDVFWGYGGYCMENARPVPSRC